MKWLRARMPFALGFLGGYLLLGCGPNVQMIYEGNVRFEHCYRLDLDESIAPSHRRACWQDWLSRHTYGQTSDRLAHARQRLQDLSRGNQATLSLLGDAGVEQTQVGAPVPMPTNIHSAPPPKAPEAKPAATPATSASGAPKLPPPDAECLKACQVQWDACSPACAESGTADDDNTARSTAKASDAGVPDPKTRKESCSVCSRTFKNCLRRCVR